VGYLNICGTNSCIWEMILYKFEIDVYMDWIIIQEESVIWLVSFTDKNHKEIWRKGQRVFPSFLKMRIFLSKWANYSPILTRMFSFWESWGTLSVFFSTFSHGFCQCLYLSPNNQVLAVVVESQQCIFQ